MSENTEKGKIHWKVVGMLFLILIILPAGSWYYLTKGYNYRKELLDDLKEPIGNVTDYQLMTVDGKPFDFSSIKNNTAIIQFLGKDALQKDFLWDRMIKLHEQFDDRNDIMFISHIPNADMVNLPKDTAQWKIVTGTEIELDRIARESYMTKWNEGETVINNSRLILLDSAQIRNYYDANVPFEMGRLLEHVTMVMPRLQEKDIIIDREKEL